MARPKKIIDAALAEEAEFALKEAPEYKIGVRLQAIISSAQYPITLVSKVLRTDRTTLRRWIKRFAAQGIDGLADAPKGHRPGKLTKEQKQQVAQWLEESRNIQGVPVHWTLSKLALALEIEFNLKLGQTAVWRLVRQLGFRQKVPRPRHAKADSQAQESFKKNPAGGC
jgi:transposase